MPDSVKVLVALADPESQRAFTSVLPNCGAEPVFASSLREARALLTGFSGEPFAMIFCEDKMADGSFRDLLPVARNAWSPVPLVVASRLEDTSEYLEAMKLGAFDFMAAPYSRREIERIVHNALHRAMAAG